MITTVNLKIFLLGLQGVLATAAAVSGCVCTCPTEAQTPEVPQQVFPSGSVEPQAEARSERAEESSGEPGLDQAAPAHAEELLEDDVGSEEPVEGPSQKRVHPLQELSDEELFQRLDTDPTELGSMSMGLPNKGSLINARPMPEDPRWILVDKSHAYGTDETVEYLKRAIGRVYEKYPDAAPLHIGHISGPKGGFLRPHLSHQSGRDVDLGYYYKQGGHWYLQADETSLDVERTWALVRALITETDVRFILIDRRIQPLLREYAESIGEDRAWLDDVFRGRGGSRPPLIRHAKGHRTHMHVRFYNPIAQETARRCYPGLVKLKLIKPPVHYIEHKVKKGETLIGLAKRYGTSVRAIKRANRLRSSKIMARKSYKIPRTGPASSGGAVSIPARRLPPASKPLPVPAL